MRRSIQFRPGLVEELEVVAPPLRRSVNWLVNEAVAEYLARGSFRSDASVAVEALAPVITSPAEVPSAVERVVERNALSVSHQARAFTPYSKEQQTGKAAKKTKPTVEVKSCRHGLLRCKVCGTG